MIAEMLEWLTHIFAELHIAMISVSLGYWTIKSLFMSRHRRSRYAKAMSDTHKHEHAIISSLAVTGAICGFVVLIVHMLNEISHLITGLILPCIFGLPSALEFEEIPIDDGWLFYVMLAGGLSTTLASFKVFKHLHMEELEEYSARYFQ